MRDLKSRILLPSPPLRLPEAEKDRDRKRQDQQAQTAQSDYAARGQAAGAELEDHLAGAGTGEAAEKSPLMRCTGCGRPQPGPASPGGSSRPRRATAAWAIHAGPRPFRLAGHVGPARRVRRIVFRAARRPGPSFPRRYGRCPAPILGLPRLCHEPDVGQRAGSLPASGYRGRQGPRCDWPPGRAGPNARRPPATRPAGAGPIAAGSSPR